MVQLKLVSSVPWREAMSVEKNKAVIRRLNDAFWNQGKAEVLDEVFAPDFVTHNPFPGQPPGREGQKQVVTQVRAAFPDIQATVEDVVAAGDKVVWRWTAQATYRGELLGIPATGKHVTFSQGDDVIDALASQGTDDSLGDRICAGPGSA